ncbi:hypothetical protein E2C01_035424 [Portunus trituberculatus]|uniref:Uncharacterized protein n=1 Tax=Portunus trituberculatus TaxID=210409 RepID=A0A5B7F9Q6_PORTR|nr:hypothetical protein [Portunus trituberculatus]
MMPQEAAHIQAPTMKQAWRVRKRSLRTSTVSKESSATVPDETVRPVATMRWKRSLSRSNTIPEISVEASRTNVQYAWPFTTAACMSLKPYFFCESEFIKTDRCSKENGISCSIVLTGDNFSSPLGWEVVVVVVVVVLGAAVVVVVRRRPSNPNLRFGPGLGFGLDFGVVMSGNGVSSASSSPSPTLESLLTVLTSEGVRMGVEGEVGDRDEGEESPSGVTTLVSFFRTPLGASTTFITTSPAFSLRSISEAGLTAGVLAVEVVVEVVVVVSGTGGAGADLLTVTFSEVTPTQKTVLSCTKDPL